MTFGEQNTLPQSFRLLDEAFAAGINFFDSAEMYTPLNPAFPFWVYLCIYIYIYVNVRVLLNPFVISEFAFWVLFSFEISTSGHV
jgi:hypothetical protein